MSTVQINEKAKIQFTEGNYHGDMIASRYAQKGIISRIILEEKDDDIKD